MENNRADHNKNLEIAKNKCKEGKFNEANEIYKNLIQHNYYSLDLIFSYGLLSKKLKNFELAKQLFFLSIKKFPVFINSYILLAEIFRNENNFIESEKILIKAKSIEPNNSDLYYNLALLYKAQGRNDLSIKFVDHAIKLSPKNKIYKILNADLLIDNGLFNLAEKILLDFKGELKQNIIIQKDILLSKLYKVQRKFKKSEKILLKLKSKFPNVQVLYLNLSDLYYEDQNIKEGIKILKDGVSLFPNFIQLQFNLALFFEKAGNIDLSIKTYLDIITKYSNHFDSFYELAKIYNFSNHKKELDAFLKIKLDQLQPLSKIKVAFSKSYIYHKKKNFEESAINLKIANDEKLKINPSDIENKLKVGEICRNLNMKDNVMSNFKVDLNQYIFIVGMPRSGSTLLETVLSMNSDVMDMGEVPYLEEVLKVEKDFKKVFGQYKNKFAKKNNLKIIYTDKYLFNFAYCPIIYYYFPNSKIIHCNRNPLDNILSIYRQNFIKVNFSSSLIDITNFYIYQSNLMNEYKEKYGSIIYSYYHDKVVSDPKKFIPKLINWLGWEWDDNYLSPHKSKRNVFTASSSQVREKINSKSVGEWSNYEELLKPAIDILSANNFLV